MQSSIQWNPSKPDTIGPNDFVLYSELSLTKGLCLFLSQSENIINIIDQVYSVKAITVQRCNQIYSRSNRACEKFSG